jgi:hypothetical protein
VPDRDLVRAGLVLAAPDATGVHEVDVELVLAHELQEAVALMVVVVGEEGVGPRHA